MTPLLPKERLRHHCLVDIHVVLIVAAVATLASLGQGLTGFGFALVAMPFFLLVLDVQESVVLAVLLSSVGLVLVAIRSRRDVRWPTVLRLLLGTVAGMPVGLVVLKFAPEDALRIGVGVAVIVMAGALARGMRVGSGGLGGEVAVGAASGVLWTSTGMSGPPVVLYLQGRGLPPLEFRAALATFFVLGNAISFSMLAGTGVVTWKAVTLAAVAVPAVLVGIWSGDRLLRRVDPALFRRLVLLLLVATSLSGIGASIQRIVG